MDDRRAETLYLERRVAQSLAMAAAATNACAQIAHTELARLYGEAIDALAMRPRRPTLHTLFPNVAAAEQANVADRAGLLQDIPTAGDRAAAERRLVSTLGA